MYIFMVTLMLQDDVFLLLFFFKLKIVMFSLWKNTKPSTKYSTCTNPGKCNKLSWWSFYIQLALCLKCFPFH